jgi:acyl-CoA synthetase (AMP-forming)/AMP-acid ligase II
MVIASPYPDVSVPEQSLSSFVLADAAERGDKPAIVDGLTGRTLSYRQLADDVRQAGCGLRVHGVRKGDVLAMCCPNSPDFAVAYHAALSVGAIVTTINPMATPADVAGQLEHSCARWLVTSPELLEKSALAVAAAGIEQVFVFGEAEGATPFAALLHDHGPIDEVAVSPDDFAVLPYSSGTTGLPKGVVLTHRGLVANLRGTAPVHRVGADDVIVAVLPLFHIYGMQVTMNLGLAAGATIVTMARFELESFLRILQDWSVTRAEVVPPIVLALAKDPAVERYDLSSLRIVTSAAAPLGDELARLCAERLECRVKQAYGMTELGGGTHFAPDDGDDMPESVGRPLPGVECRVVDCATGADVAPGNAGELLVRAPGAMWGYLGDAAATVRTVDADGWLRTGDVVCVDADSWFFIVDRVKELIKYKAHQVAPAELEAVLVSHPAVADAAVVGSPDEEAGEAPKAFVVLRAPASEEELVGFVADRVAPYKKIRLLEFVEQIPKSPSGKILRRVLVERERERACPAAVSVGADR